MGSDRAARDDSPSLGTRGVNLAPTPRPWLQAAKEDDLALSKEALFDVAPDGNTPEKPDGGKNDAPLPSSKEDLFGIEDKAGQPAMDSAAGTAAPPAANELPIADAARATPEAEGANSAVWHGFVQAELAYVYAEPEHWSKTMGRLQLGTQGRHGGIKWNVNARLNYNPVYDLTDHYTRAVRDDQRAELELLETYLDFSTGAWDWRVGRQHVVWGEMVGLFFADVVSAKDLREFILPDFQTLRIPQWAARAEYFEGDFHAEVVWIPFPSYDRIGKPFSAGQPGVGADFYPYPPSPAGIPFLIAGEDLPDYHIDNTNYGLRLSQLIDGWDLSGFWYSSMDSMPTFHRQPVGPLLSPTAYVYQPRHERIWQAGGTLAKDFGDFVLKAELVYTNGRRYNTLAMSDADGVVKQNTLDWILGLDFNPGTDTRLNTQLYQRIYFDHDPHIVPDRLESGVSLLANHKFPHNWEAEVLLIHSLNRGDWLLRPKLAWGFQPNWRVVFGVDVFGGPATGLFGQYDERDRVYTELRYDF